MLKIFFIECLFEVLKGLSFEKFGKTIKIKYTFLFFLRLSSAAI